MDDKPKRRSVNLTDLEWSGLQAYADSVGVTTCQLVRMMVRRLLETKPKPLHQSLPDLSKAK